jgi:hypothetical protein
MTVATCSRRTIPALLLVVLAASGCQAHRSASLVYPPPDEPRAAVPPQVPAGAPVVALRSVTDERHGDRTVVGAYVRVPQAQMTPVQMKLVTADDVAGWVRGAVRRELQLAGLSVVEPAAASGAPALDVALLGLSCGASEATRISAGRVDVRAVLGGPGRALLDDVYRALVNAGIGLADEVTDEGIEACLANGLRDVARRIAADAARILRAPANAPAAATPAATPTAPAPPRP